MQSELPRRLLVTVAAIGLLGAAGRPVLAQQAATAPAPPPVPIRILLAGGLLGQFDGMPEYPGGSFDSDVGPGLHPYGGLQGLTDWMTVHAAEGPPPLFLMTANNLPRDVMAKGAASVDLFLDGVRALKPFAIAVGTEDFLRGLENRGTARLPPGFGQAHATAPVATRDVEGTPGLLVSWLRQSNLRPDERLPFLVSNAAVRLHALGLNHVEDRGFTLQMAADSSIGWVTELSLAFPCARQGEIDPRGALTAHFTRRDASGVAPPEEAGDAAVTIDRGGSQCRARLGLRSPLRPGSIYALDVQVAGAPAAAFSFRTDDPLTNDLVRVPAEPEQPIVVALVDPHVRSILAKERWIWQNGEGGAPCVADAASPAGSAAACEILILPPTDALDTALALAEPTPTARPVALLSDLTDKDTLALLQHSPRIRVVAWPPDSTALGRAALRTASAGAGTRAGRGGAAPVPAGDVPGPYSGDLGYGAVVNMSVPEATAVWTRPEWFSETIAEIDATVTRREAAPAGHTASSSSAAPAATWELTGVTHTIDSVKGWALCARPAPQSGPDGRTPVDYFLENWHVDAQTGATVYEDVPTMRLAAVAPNPYPPLDPAVPYDASGRFPQGELWTNRNVFAAVALDAMRARFDTDLALLPDSAIDDGWLNYLADDAHAPGSALSKILLERVLFRAGAIIKVRLPASSLVDTIGRIDSAGQADGVSYCLSGLGTSGCGAMRLNKQSTFINGRRLDANRFYTVAMPESVALDSGLAREGADEDDLVSIMDAVFAAPAGAVEDSCSADYRRPPPAAAEATPPAATAAAPPPAAPSGAPGGQGSGGGARGGATLAAALEDARAHQNTPYIYITPAEFSFSQTQIAEPAGGQGLFNKLGLPNSGARPSRRLSTNIGLDVGIIDMPQWALRALGSVAYGRALVNGQSSTDPNASLAALRVDWKLRPGRLYAGWFWESQFTDEVTDVTASLKGVAGPTLPLVTPRRDYKYVGGGFELEQPQVARWLSINPLRISAAVGVSAHELTDIQVDGQSQGLAAFQQLGATGLLNKYYASHPSLSAASVYAFVDQSLRRDRVQVDCTPRVTLPFGGKKLALSLDTSYLRFVGPNAAPLAERQGVTVKLTIAVPLYGLATLNLNGNASWAQVNGINGWYTVWQPSVSISIPVIGARHAGWVW